MTDTAWSGLEIAVVGMSGRFPGAGDVAEFWRKLRDGVECIETFTDDELSAAGVEPALLADPRYVKRGAVLEDIELFDAAFFGITPREAELMDPQHRMFLESAWTVLEDAGHDPARFRGSIGVYGGASTNTYFTENVLTSGTVESGGLPSLFGNQADYLTTRVSYKLNLRGPSLDVQTSCSSSLVAVHLACQALLSGECDLALAGGVTVTVPNVRGYLYQEQGIYSPDGHCRAFSKDAQGTVGGNGVAVVALRRLQDALDDGDCIRSVIKGSAINNDGSGKVGYAAPSVDGQAAVVRAALAMAEVEPDSVRYVETHGTGTSLGDPIEVAALTEAFRSGTQATGFCRIGSVKTNIGHLDVAAGVTGLVKASLALQNRELPPSLNCDEPDPKIDFQSTPFVVNTELREWDGPGPRRAGVSSFGIGGTNAHVILEEAPEPPARTSTPRSRLFVLSARTAPALEQTAANLAAHLRAHPELDPADVAFTLQTGRANLPHRRAIVGRDLVDVANLLEGGDEKRVQTAVQEEGERSVVFMFTGQGAQYVDMGRGLYETEPTFKRHVDAAAAILEPQLDLLKILYPEPAGADAAAAELVRTSATQPALFVVEYALARLWMEWGVEPAAMIGHSIGEYVAATLAGVFDLEGALALVAARGRLMQDLPEGSMLAVPLPAAEVEPLLGDALSLAAVNEPSSCVASGPDAASAALEEELRGRGVATRKLQTSHAFHSAMMDPILASFTERVRAAAPKAPRIPFVSNLTGTWIRDDEATDPEYWARHLRGTVRFADGVAELAGDPARVLLEVGPGNTLTTLANRVARKSGAGDGRPSVYASVRHPREEADDREFLLGALGRLWLARVPFEVTDEEARRVPLPTYPFEGRRFWIEPGAGPARPVTGTGKKPDVADWFYAPSWKRSAPLVASASAASQYLVFEDRGGVGDELARRLVEEGKRVTRVAHGDGFGRSAEDRFTVRPGELADHRALVEELGRSGRVPEVVVHAWCADPGNERALDLGLFSLLFLAQAGERKEPLEILVVTRGAQSVLGDEELVPEKAAALGVARSITQECAGVSCRCIDLDPAGAPEADAARLVSELAADTADTVVALRGRHRWIESFEPVRVAEPESSPVREGGHYLVVGGLGSIGLEVARALARTPSVRLVLVGRSEFPARSEWEAWPTDDDTRKRIGVLQSLERGGAELFVASADVTDGARMQAVVEAAEERFGPLNGIVHAAGGEKAMALLSETTREACEAQLAPKLEGLRVLEELSRTRELDFCVVQSSLSSCLGALGMVGYVAAHHVVDAFVAEHNRRAGDSPWTVVNWDNWLSWKEPEIAHSTGEESFFMAPDEGGEAFLRAVALPRGTHVAVSTGDLPTRIEQWIRVEDSTAPPAAQSSLHERPDLSSEYAAATSPAEEVLVEAWSEVLGIGGIGVRDSFFDLGGDSVLGLQVVAKAGQRGLRITPAQIFERPTIAELAAVAEERAQPVAEQGRVEGSAPLIPIQRWFFELGIPDPEHFNLPMLFQVPADAGEASEDRIASALASVVEHHDALRLRFVRHGGEVEQTHAAEAAKVEVRAVDLSTTPDGERTRVMAERATELHRGFDLEHGPMTRAVLFRSGPGRPQELLWIVHHLLVDAVSWRILLEDLGTALSQVSAGKRVELPKKTTSFREWAVALDEHAQSDAARAELDHWLSVGEAEAPSLPTDLESGPDVFSSAKTLSVALDEEQTKALLMEVGSAYETRIDEVLLSALALGFSRWTGSETLAVDLEGHGREDVVEGLDLSRTVGWFTTIYPALLTLSGTQSDPGRALKAIKEQVRGIPRHGLGFGLLRYSRRDPEVEVAMRALPRPEVNFLYLGQFDAVAEGAPLELLSEKSGAPCSPDAPRGHLFEIVALVRNHRLRVDFTYSANRHRRETVEGLSNGFLQELEGLIAHCRTQDAGGRTPSDFPAARVSQSDLDSLLTKIGRPGKGKKA